MEFYLDKIYFEMDRFEEALAAFDNATANLLDKKCWNLHGYVLLGKGMAYKMMGQFDKSLLFCNLAESFSPMNATLGRSLASILLSFLVAWELVIGRGALLTCRTSLGAVVWAK